jgi:DNA-binding SARP family transcriptional activator
MCFSAARSHVAVARRSQPGRTGGWYGGPVLVRVLGQSRIADGDAVDGADPAADLRPMERRLLAALAVRRPPAVSVDSLGEALWVGDAPASMRKAIHNHVLRLRAQLGRSVVETVEHGYRLGPDVELDIERFEEAVRAAERANGASVASWDAALAWCGDAPLAELGHWAPADARRARLDELLRSGVEARWEAALAEGSPGDTIPDLEALVAAAPLRERRWALLLTAYQRAGRRAAGLRAFERARHILAVEIGVSPGPELVEAYESLLRDEPTPSGAPGAGRHDPVSRSDRQRDEALAAIERGDHRAAVAAFIAAAGPAREAGDARRFAEAALGAAGDGWRTSLDATGETVSLLAEAVERVPVGPTPLRSRLMARLAVVRSHHIPVAEAEASASRALAIARALGQPGLLAGALHALAVVVWDPRRRDEHWAWANELMALATGDPAQPWRRWALPIVARLRVTDGDVAGACRALDELDAEGSACRDPVARFSASIVGILRATVAGDWAAARVATAATRAWSEAVAVEPGDSALMEMGLLGIIDLLAGPSHVPAMPPLDWPVPSMALAVKAGHADALARVGRLDEAAAELAAIGPDAVTGVPRDGYWLATLSMLADAAYLAGSPPVAGAVHECLRPVAQVTIVDPGLCYRGTAAHATGLAAATCGRHREARDLLSAGLARHREHGSPWMTQRSEDALARLSRG